MLCETAHVVALESDSVWVETIRQSTCGGCVANKGCGHSLLDKISTGRRNHIRVFSGDLNADDCSVDDQVRISIPEQVIVRGSLLVYILPLVVMLSGASLASMVSFGNPDLMAITGAALGFVAGVTVVRLHAWLHRFDKNLQPRLMEFVNSTVDLVTLT